MQIKYHKVFFLFFFIHPISINHPQTERRQMLNYYSSNQLCRLNIDEFFVRLTFGTFIIEYCVCCVILQCYSVCHSNRVSSSDLGIFFELRLWKIRKRNLYCSLNICHHFLFAVEYFIIQGLLFANGICDKFARNPQIIINIKICRLLINK